MPDNVTTVSSSCSCRHVSSRVPKFEPARGHWTKPVPLWLPCGSAALPPLNLLLAAAVRLQYVP